MRATFLSAALVLVTALTAVAEPPRWKFKPGQTFTYECRSTFHFATFQLARRGAVTPERPREEAAVVDIGPPQAAGNAPAVADGIPTDPDEFAQWLDKVRRDEIQYALENETDPTRRAGLQALLNKRGLITTEEVMAMGVDPQWETVTLTAVVAAIGDDGTARLKLTVDAVRIETRFDDTGAHATWDSTEHKAARFEGFMPYQAMVGHTFEALVGVNGSIKELSGGAWPAPAAAGTFGKKDRREASAANATHQPTPARAWLEVLFTMTPSGGDQWERTVLMPGEEVLSLRADSPEPAGGFPCVRAKLHSRDREHSVAAAKLAFQKRDGDLAMQMCSEAQKVGHSWFAPGIGCVVKSEMKSSSEANGNRLIVGDFEMVVELKSRGFRAAPPMHEGDSSGISR